MRPERRELAVVVDRSRDAVSSGHFTGLHQDPRFRVTENERRLTERLLARADVLLIETCAAARYTAAELTAVQRFVRRGGGLLLTTSAGAFQVLTGRPIARSAAQQVADLFSLRFLPPTDAQARTSADASFTAGYRRNDLSLSAWGPLRDWHLHDLSIDRAAPMALPKGARALLRHRRTGELVAAVVRAGRGRVVAANSLTFGHRWQTVGRSIVAWLAGRLRRPRDARPLPDVVPAPATVVARGALRVDARGVSAKRVDGILALVADLVGRYQRLFRPTRRFGWDVHIVPGGGCSLEWTWQTRRPTVRIGADTCRPALIYTLARAVCRPYLVWFAGGYGSLLNRTLDSETLNRHLALRTLASFGFDAQAHEWRMILEAWPDGRGGDPRAVDLGRWRAETGPSPAMWVWRALEEDLGAALIDRFLRRQPRDMPWDKFPHWDVVTELDILIYYLSLAAKRDLFEWFRAHGTTVHPIPLVQTGDKGFKRRCLAPLHRLMRDPTASLSERFDAARALAAAKGRGKTRAAHGGDEADRLVSALRLARVRDARALRALRALLRQARDPAHAAIAAATLVEAGDGAAADSLVQKAHTADARFQLDAAAVLAHRVPGETTSSRETKPGKVAPAPVREPLRGVLARVGRTVPSPVTIARGREDGDLRLRVMAEGYLAANVFSTREIERWPGGIVVPRAFVAWVHTAPKWRRKGLSRALVERTLGHPWMRQAATAGLWTGTTNTAHAIYRAAGFIDLQVTEFWSRSPAAPEAVPRVRGVRLRRAARRDVGRMTRLFNEVYRDYFAVGRRRAVAPPNDQVALVAEGKGGLVGFITGAIQEPYGRGRPAGYIAEVCVKPSAEAARVTHALAARFCADAAGRGAAAVTAGGIPEDEAVRSGFNAAGFASREAGGVIMWRLNSLPDLLRCIRPILEARLREKKQDGWCGTIAIYGERHRAALVFERGRVRIAGALPSRANIALEANDDAISRLVVGRESPSQAVLQGRMSISPRPNAEVTALLDCLFPRVKRYLV